MFATLLAATYFSGGRRFVKEVHTCLKQDGEDYATYLSLVATQYTHFRCHSETYSRHVFGQICNDSFFGSGWVEVGVGEWSVAFEDQRKQKRGPCKCPSGQAMQVGKIEESPARHSRRRKKEPISQPVLSVPGPCGCPSTRCIFCLSTGSSETIPCNRRPECLMGATCKDLDKPTLKP